MNIVADHLSRYPIKLDLDVAAKEGKRENAMWADQVLLPVGTQKVEMFDSH